MRFVLLLSFACAWLAGSSTVRAQDAPVVDDRPFRYEPPNVDRVYPEAGEPGPGPTQEKAPDADRDDAPDAGAPEAGSADAADPTETGSGTSPGGGVGSAPARVATDEAHQPAPPKGADGDAPRAGSAPAAEPPSAEAVPSEPGAGAYGATGRVERREPGTRELSLEDARDLPGVFGDPLRVVELLPGVVPVSSGLPYFYSRGSPPANQGYRFDDLLLPQLFHVAIGPQVLHPRMFEGVSYYGAVAPTNYGRKSGALVDVEPAPHAYALSGEVDLRLLDVNAFVEAPVLGGNLQVAGRYGYPGLLLSAFVPGAKLTYWDGQVRYELPLDLDNRLQLVWVGSFDDAINLPLSTGPTETTALSLHFHRIALRVLHDTPRGGELGVALRFGYDDSSLGTALASTAFTFGPRFWYRQPFGEGHRLEVGADMLGSTGDVRDMGGTLGAFGGVEGQLDINLPTLGEASARNQGGVYGEVVLRTSDRTELRAGARVDLWHVQDVVNVGVDPRLRFAWQATDTTEVQVAGGLAHQPAVFLLPLPGLSDVALSDTLTRNYQAELGVHQELPWNMEVEVTPFFSYQQNLLLPELIEDGNVAEDPPLVDARATGVELFAQGDVEHLRFLASYTLGFAEAYTPPRLLGTFSPDFDVRHVLNLTARYDFPKGFNVGVRFGTRSGRMIEQQNPRYAQRLPWFSRLDVRVGYGWQGRWAWMDAYFEWLNVTFQGEYLDADCFFGQCVAERAPALSVPNLGIRATFDGSRR